MQIYTNDDSLNIVQSTASTSTMIGSLASSIRDYFVSNFPPGYFKSIYVNTAETVSEIKRNYKYDQVLDKIPYPSLQISPEMSLDDPIGNMAKQIHLNSPNIFLRKDMRQVYKTLLIDPNEKVSIYYTSDYITTVFNFNIVTNTFMNNTDIAYFLKSRFQMNFFRFLNNQILGTEIPKSFIKILANLQGLDTTNNADMNKLRLYLIGSNKRQNRIEKKTNLATGKPCFFVNELVDFLTQFSDINCETTINRNNMSEAEYPISIRLQVSTYLPNAFIMNINRQVFEKLPSDIQNSINSEDQQDSGIYLSDISFSGNDIKVKDTIVAYNKETINFTDNSGTEMIGSLIYKEIYRYNQDDVIKVINVMDTISSEFKKIHALITSDLLKGFDLSSLIYAKVYDSSGEIPKDKYKFDIRKMTITFNDNYEIKSDIAVYIYLNRVAYEAVQEAAKQNKYFMADFMATMVGVVNGKRKLFPIKSFSNKKDLYSTDINKMFRVSTDYGIGYVPLKDAAKKTDQFRICVGYNDDQPIIKTFEELK